MSRVVLVTRDCLDRKHEEDGTVPTALSRLLREGMYMVWVGIHPGQRLRAGVARSAHAVQRPVHGRTEPIDGGEVTAAFSPIDGRLGVGHTSKRQAKTHLTPLTKLGGGTPAAGTRPTTFLSWWEWGVDQAGGAKAKAPLAIHSQSGDRAGWGNVKRGFPRGLPFHRPFVSYVLRHNPFVNGAFARGMAPLCAQRGRQTDEFRIIYALLSGHTDPQVVRAVILGGPHQKYFEETAIRALEFVYEKVAAELATAKDPDAPAGAA